jgi:hypothetical protein
MIIVYNKNCLEKSIAYAYAKATLLGHLPTDMYASGEPRRFGEKNLYNMNSVGHIFTSE